jgi:hypothetical protein
MDTASKYQHTRFGGQQEGEVHGAYFTRHTPTSDKWDRNAISFKTVEATTVQIQHNTTLKNYTTCWHFCWDGCGYVCSLKMSNVYGGHSMKVGYLQHANVTSSHSRWLVTSQCFSHGHAVFYVTEVVPSEIKENFKGNFWSQNLLPRNTWLKIASRLQGPMKTNEWENWCYQS